ncbi:toxin [Pseudomonas brassicacearum]|uniref:Tc toxin subunit A-related protein n=1 Tax=Pseudomonas brassicacearum TaxID=930166 RepID=UPI000F46DDE5|nr:neuraminidase-like domain-containing protein [Pseudomonas brassicacearum]ROM70093.1 toxin [Pseudomonas brassicacearum]
MTVAIKKQLDESLRDAQLALYLNKVAPNNPTTRNLRFKTAEALYEHWLLDVLVSQDVPTTPVACAIASLQQYIHRILMNLEPGYDSASLGAEHLETWRNELHQYPTWAAHQKLLYFPSIYLDPLLRANKSDNFRQLENDLNQNHIQPDAVQSAVMAYLTRLEEVANLNILTGYIDGEDLANSTYYFIGKSRSENSYFWRSLNMAQRPLDGTPPPPPATPPKLDQPDPYAWSDWEKANVPISESAVEHSIRPVWFNNRLFVVWAECIHQDPSATRNASATSQAAGNHPLLRLSLCFKKPDGSWSTPRVCLQGYCEDSELRSEDLEAIKALVGTVAVQYRKGARDVLFLGLCAREAKTDSIDSTGNHFTFIKTTCIDTNLTPEPGSSATTEQTAKEHYRQYSADEKTLISATVQRIQTKTFAEIVPIEVALPANMEVSMSDFDGHRHRIGIESVEGPTASTLTLRMSAVINVDGGIGLPSNRKEMRLRLSSSRFITPRLQFGWVLPARSLPGSAYMALNAGSFSLITSASSKPLDQNYRMSFDHLNNVIRDNDYSLGITLSDDLQGKLVSTQAVRHLITQSRRENDGTASGRVQNLTLQTSDSPPLNLGETFVELDEPLDIQYVIFRQPHAGQTQPLTYENLQVVAESIPAPNLAQFHEFTWHSKDLGQHGDTFLCGVAFVHPDEPGKKIYSALKAIKLKLTPARLQPPTITHASAPGLGAGQPINFAGSAIKDNDVQDKPRAPIRLNTVFAAELIRRTENSLDELFDWQTQHLPEPVLSSDANNKMDFHGPYGRYFTELFLYVPWLIAHRLNTEQRYEEAERWLRHVFDPSRGHEDCWKSVPLIDSNTTAYHDQAPHDPHQIALSHPVHFRKALYFLYLDILINRGDAAYRALTPDSLSEAKLWYVRAQELLGPRAVVQTLDQWTSISLQALSESSNEKLRGFERFLSQSDTRYPLRIRDNPSPSSLPALDTPYLRVPFNPELLKRWDITESRLYNLRHNLDIVGKPLHLPLFAPPLDPRALPGANALNIADSAAPGLSLPHLPNYRFMVMHSQAQSAVESLSQFGATLLSLIERKEQAQLQELQQQQAWDLAKIAVDLQRQALKIDRHNRQALLASRSIVEGRAHHYQHLLDKGVSEVERQACRLYLRSGAAERNASDSQAVAGSLMMTPNIFGFSNGGSRWEGALHAAAAIAQGTAISDRTTAAHLERTAQFHRRRQEWTQARDQAQLELAQVDAQLAHVTEQETATRLQLRLAESSLGQAKTNYDFFRKRFTKAQLYQWLNSQFAALYRQAYDATVGLCLAAEACWQYELADLNRRFIQPGTWNATYRGLAMGEQLKLSLLNMQAEYLRRNERDLEIRKTVSLRQLKSKTATSTLNKEWAQIHADLLQGQCEFELTQELFEDDYKDRQHYLRRIKTISVSLPALVGPYENIRATLTQTASKVFMSPGGRSVESRYAHQQIALSTGVDDNGLFTLNFNDERYLPFEYTGAVSTWCLTFPNPEAQRDMLESLTDIIVQVNYTARAGGGSR